MHRSGFIALIGRPNVGKSTLLNTLVGEKVAIISGCPQTTRNQIRAVLTLPMAQAIFIDTPGVHKPKHKLGTSMVNSSLQTLREVELICFIVEANCRPGPGDKYIANLLSKVESPIFLVLNKIDLTSEKEKMEHRFLYEKTGSYEATFEISAEKGTNIPQFIDEIVNILPEGPQYYPPDMITDQPEKVLAAEIIREKIIPLTRQEIPFSIAVVVDELATRKETGLLDIRAEIFVERKSQVGIIVGKNGRLLKQAGTLARKELEALFGQKIFLDLRVKVRKDWRNSNDYLKRFGYR